MDLERLLHLLRLLATYPELSAADPATRSELEAALAVYETDASGAPHR